MRIFKSHPLLKLVNSYVIDSPQPSNLSYLWNFGSLLAFCLVIQIVTGVTLAMHYNPSVLEAFNSVEHIMRDVNNGWLIRYLHSNTASAFFFLVYLHMGRGFYYGSYTSPRTLVWTLGTIIFLLMIVTAFLGIFNIAQNGFNLQQQIQQQQQQQMQNGSVTFNLQSSFLSLVFEYKIFRALQTILLVLILLLLVISLALGEENNDIFDTSKDESRNENTELNGSGINKDTNTKINKKILDETSSESETTSIDYDADIEIKKDNKGLLDTEWDIINNQIINLEAFLNNGQLKVIKIDHYMPSIDLEFLTWIISKDPYEDLSEEQRNKKIIYDYIVNVDINRAKHLKESTGLNSPSVDTGNVDFNDLPTGTIPDDLSDSDTSEYETLIKAIRDGKNITIYNSAENSPIKSKDSSGDWSKLEPLPNNNQYQDLKEIIKPKQLVIITDNIEGKPIIPLPSFGIVSKKPSMDDTQAHDNWKKEVAIKKAWASKYPFFPEHYKQMETSSNQASNEAWWLQQQDNTITYEKPTEEDQESLHLEELFGEKPYDKSNNNKSSSGKRHYSTINNLNKRNYTTSADRSNSSKILKEFIAEKNIEPVFMYENLVDITINKKIQEDTKGLSGIYLILNKVTMDYYIGSASTNRINKRFANHLIHLTGSKVIKNAVKKYKLSEFAFLVLELFPEIVTRENNKKLLDLEDFYLKSLLPNYNILTEAGSSFGYKHSELTRLKMVANYSQERRENIGNLNRNKKFSEATIASMREKALNRMKPIYTEQGLENMKKSSKSIIVYNLDRTVYGKYSSIVDTAKDLNCYVKTISRSLKSDTKLLKKRWIINYNE